MKSIKTTSFVLDGVQVCIPVVLYKRLELLAHQATITIEEYVREIRSEKYPKVTEWNVYPADIQIMLCMFNFCLEDLDSSFKTLKKINRERAA